MKAAFLDRDGVINRSLLVAGKPRPPSDISEVIILEGVKEALQIIEIHNYVPVVVTNQPDIGRGLTTIDEVNSINNFIQVETGIKHFFICPHDDNDRCNCRKPKPGLIIQAVKELKLELNGCFLVGDRWRDIESGNELGLETFFIDYSYPEKLPNPPFKKVESLLKAVNLFFKTEQR